MYRLKVRLQLFPFDFRMCTALASHQMFCMPSWKCVVRLFQSWMEKQRSVKSTRRAVDCFERTGIQLQNWSLVFFRYQGISGERGLTWPLGRVRQWGCWLKSVCSAVTTNLQILLSRHWHKVASGCSPEHPAPKQRWHLCGTWHWRAEEPEPGQGQLEQQPARDTRRCSMLATQPSWAVS